MNIQGLDHALIFKRLQLAGEDPVICRMRTGDRSPASPEKP